MKSITLYSRLIAKFASKYEDETNIQATEWEHSIKQSDAVSRLEHITALVKAGKADVDTLNSVLDIVEREILKE